MERKLNIIGIAGERKSMEEIDEILAERRKNWKPREAKYKKGVLRLFSQHAASPMWPFPLQILELMHHFLQLCRITVWAKVLCV